MQTDEVRHTRNRHGPGAPLQTGEIPVTPDDLARVPQILAEAQDVRRGDTGIGLPALIFTHRAGNTATVIEEVRAGRRWLAFKSMRIFRRGDGGPDAMDVPPESGSPPIIRPEPLAGTADSIMDFADRQGQLYRLAFAGTTRGAHYQSAFG